MYDVIIIGAGPAGISAGIYSASRGKKTLILEKAKVGGLIGSVSTVTHYASVGQQESGAEFARRLEEQALRSGVEIRIAEVTGVELTGAVKTISTTAGEFQAAKVILASGTSPRRLDIPGADQLTGRGMAMNAARDGESYAGKQVFVVGGADGAVKEALYLARFAAQVTIIHFEPDLACVAEFREKLARTPNVSLRLNSRLHGVYGVDRVESLEIADERTGAIDTLEAPGCGIFVYAGAVPNTQLFTQLHLVDGFIPTGEDMQTEIPGVYAIGDVRVKTVRQISTAVADGTIAAIAAAK